MSPIVPNCERTPLGSQPRGISRLNIGTGYTYTVLHGRFRDIPDVPCDVLSSSNDELVSSSGSVIENMVAGFAPYCCGHEMNTEVQGYYTECGPQRQASDEEEEEETSSEDENQAAEMAEEGESESTVANDEDKAVQMQVDCQEGQLEGSGASLSFEEEKPQAQGQYFSEYEIRTDPNVFRHPYLIIQNDDLTGPGYLRRGENGYFCLKAFTSQETPDTNTPRHDCEPWTKLQYFTISNSWWDDELQDPGFFDKYATLVFVETPGRYTKGGDAMYEFIGSFYLRTLGESPLMQDGSVWEMSFGYPNQFPESFVTLQFAEEPSCFRTSPAATKHQF